jgi:hypothetical protein
MCLLHLDCRYVLVQTYVFCAFACAGASAKDPNDKDRKVGVTAEQNALLDSCKNMDREEFAKFLAGLSKDHRIDDLRSLAAHHELTPFGVQAVGEYAGQLSTDELIVYCCKSSLRSMPWRVAFYTLSEPKRRKEDVIEYVKQIATSSNPDARAVCYQICTRRKWDDLMAQAKNDVHSKEKLVGPTTYFGYFGELGHVASHYLGTLRENDKK